MATTTVSGYLATAASALTTELNSLANGSVSALSSEIDNVTNKYAMADLVLTLASLTPTSGGSISFYIVATVDGTTYPSFDTGASPGAYNNNYFRESFELKAATGAQTIVLADARAVVLPNGKFKVAVKNSSGVALASSGNTLEWRPHSYASV